MFLASALRKGHHSQKTLKMVALFKGFNSQFGGISVQSRYRILAKNMEVVQCSDGGKGFLPRRSSV